jgi:hypothetical protein
MEASGLSEHDISQGLQKAWDRGHDAVAIHNYTRPGGTTPETVIVVRDANQLRSPKAAFDPARKLSPDLMAAIAGAAVVPATVLGQMIDRREPQSSGMPDDTSAILGSGQPPARWRD